MAVPMIRLNSGKLIPQFGFGCWSFSEMVTSGMDHNKFADAIKAPVTAAIDAGYRHFDTAMNYRNEKQVGEALKAAIAAGKVTREELFVTTKIAMIHHPYDHAKEAIDSMLQQLDLGYIDLLLIHFPIALGPMRVAESWKHSLPELFKLPISDTDYMETWKAMEEAVKAGKVRSIGVSNFNAEQIQRVIDNGSIPPANVQVECHPSFPQSKLKQFLDERGITLTAYSPLQNPSLNQHKKGNLMENACIVNAAKTYGKENMNIFDFKLSDNEMAEIAKLDMGAEGRHTYPILAGSENHKYFPFKAAY